MTSALEFLIASNSSVTFDLFINNLKSFLKRSHDHRLPIQHSKCASQAQAHTQKKYKELEHYSPNMSNH